MSTVASVAGPSDSRWRPAPFLKLSAGLHVAGAGMLAVHPDAWPWVLGILGTDQAVLSTVGMFPRSTMLGPNVRRLPEPATKRGEIALTFDDGPDPEVTPRVLDLLDAHGASASFFCIGERAAAHPQLVAEIARRGHSVENHTHSHSVPFAFYGPARLRREIESTQIAIERCTGRAPVYFRAPFGIRSPMLEPVIARAGLQLVSWTRRGIDTLDGNPTKVAGRLTQGLAGGDILLLHDRAAARTSTGIPVVLAVLPALLERMASNGLRSVTLPVGLDARAHLPHPRAA